MNQLLLRSGGAGGQERIEDRGERGERRDERRGREGGSGHRRTDGGEAARALLNQLIVLDSGAGE